MADINVTPLVDVMLVLLIIFMVTAPLLVAGVPVDLPEVLLEVGRAESGRDAEPVGRQAPLRQRLVEPPADVVDEGPRARGDERLRVLERADDVGLRVDQGHEAAGPERLVQLIDQLQRAVPAKGAPAAAAGGLFGGGEA